MNKAAFYKISKRINKLRDTKLCHAPSNDCDGAIIRAHTLSESLMLRPLAKNGHVYTYAYEAKPTREVRDQIQFTLRGVNQTSVFFGFCKKHDRDLFSCIETEAFTCAPKQFTMLYFRALAREYHAKLLQLESRTTPEELKTLFGVPDKWEIIPSEEDLFFEEGTIKAVAEIQRLKDRFDQIVRLEDYSRVITHVFEIDGIFPVACSGITNPDFDFDGNLIQNIVNLEFECSLISFSVVVQEEKSFVLLSYLDLHAPIAEKFISSLLQRSDVGADLIWMTFCHFENCAYAPDWVDSLSDATREELMRATFDNINKFDPAFGIIADRKVELPCPKVTRNFRI